MSAANNTAPAQGQASPKRKKILLTLGSIFVEMKKNSESRHFPTGWIDSAYAAGNARTSTRMVEQSVAIAECSM